MIIASVHVRNLCGLLDATLNCDSLTALVGGNGCGKSTFVKALELFYSTRPRFSTEDFYSNDTSQDIQITVTYTELSEQAQKLFAHYLSDDMLTITRVLSLADGKPSSKSRLETAEPGLSARATVDEQGRGSEDLQRITPAP